MEVRYLPNPEHMDMLSSEEVRDNFLVETLFRAGELTLLYSDTDRAIVGSAVPTKKPLELVASKKEMAADYFCERREVGVINIGSEGVITVDGTAYRMASKDCLYIGRGSKEVTFESASAGDPAEFYILSYPAHAEYPTTHGRFADAETQELGSQKDANTRTIYKYIHPNGIKSSQLVMGLTMLEEGNVWNTMPPHTHMRRSEIYMYFNLDEKAILMHFMGEPDRTRHIVMRNKQAVISPSWSIHSACGTQNYTFIWGMGGENQAFADMDHLDMDDLA